MMGVCCPLLSLGTWESRLASSKMLCLNKYPIKYVGLEAGFVLDESSEVVALMMMMRREAEEAHKFSPVTSKGQSPSPLTPVQ